MRVFGFCPLAGRALLSPDPAPCALVQGGDMFAVTLADAVPLLAAKGKPLRRRGRPSRGDKEQAAAANKAPGKRGRPKKDAKKEVAAKEGAEGGAGSESLNAGNGQAEEVAAGAQPKKRVRSRKVAAQGTEAEGTVRDAQPAGEGRPGGEATGGDASSTSEESAGSPPLKRKKLTAETRSSGKSKAVKDAAAPSAALLPPPPQARVRRAEGPKSKQPAALAEKRSPGNVGGDEDVAVAAVASMRPAKASPGRGQKAVAATQTSEQLASSTGEVNGGAGQGETTGSSGQLRILNEWPRKRRSPAEKAADHAAGVFRPWEVQAGLHLPFLQQQQPARAAQQRDSRGDDQGDAGEPSSTASAAEERQESSAATGRAGSTTAEEKGRDTPGREGHRMRPALRAGRPSKVVRPREAGLRQGEDEEERRYAVAAGH